MLKRFKMMIGMFLISTSLIYSQDLESVSTSLFHEEFKSITIVNNYIYCPGRYGLNIFSIEDTSDPTLVKRCDFGSLWEIKVIDNYAYISGSPLKILDVSDVLNPTIIGCSDHGGRGIEIYGDYAYTSAGFLGMAWIYIFDISDVSNPSYLDSIELSCGTCKIDGMAIKDSCLLVSWYDIDMPGGGDLEIYSLSNPSHPEHLGRIDMWVESYPRDIAIAGDYAYVSGPGPPFYILNIANPYNVYIEDTLGTISGRPGFIENNLLYLTGNGIKVANIDNPTNPIVIGDLVDEYASVSVFVADDIAYYTRNRITSYNNSNWLYDLIKVDVAQPETPAIIGEYNAPHKVMDVQIHGNYAFVANNISGLRVLDVSDPYNIESVCHVETESQAIDIFLSGDYAYLANYDLGLKIFDISDPENAYEVGYHDTLDYCRYVFIEGDRAYVINSDAYDQRILILDISDPSNPTTLSVFDDYDLFRFIYVKNNTAYITITDALEIVDFSEPSNPNHLGSYEFEGRGFNLFVDDYFAYVATYPNGLEIIDISNSHDPFLVGASDSLNAFHVAVSDNYAYLSRGTNGICIFDVSDPLQPVLISSYSNDRYNYCIRTEVSIQNEFIFTAANEFFEILRLTPTGIEQIAEIPTSFTLSPNYPNPFNSSTTISYTLPYFTNVNLDIYDILGRKVETLVNAKQQAGYHQVIWDADDIVSGIYFYKISVGDYTETRQMVLLK